MAITVENADAYFQNEVFLNDAWVNADTASKQRALKNAENMLYRFYKALDPVDKPVPDKAVYEQAYFIMLIDETIQKSALGVRQVSVSGIAISLDTYGKTTRGLPISPEAQAVVSQEAGIGGGVRLGRTVL
jgi:hypothetical protein